MARRGTNRNADEAQSEMRKVWAKRAKARAAEDIDAKHKRLQGEIGSLLQWMEDELDAERAEPITWATIGSLVEIRSQLKGTLAFLSGVGPREIEQALDELSM